MGCGFIMQNSVEASKIDLEGNDKLFTTSWEYMNPDNVFTFTRKHGSAGRNWKCVSGNSGEIISGFDSAYPWSDFKLCNMEADGTITAYYGDDGFSFEKNTMVEIPKYYYQITDDGTCKNFSISSIPREGFYVSPRHRKFGNRTKDMDKIYLGAFFTNYNMQHLGLLNTYNMEILINDIIEGAKTLGSNWYMMDYAMYMTALIPKIIETNSFSKGFMSTPEWTDRTINTSYKPGYFNTFSTMNGTMDDTGVYFRYRGFEMLDYFRTYYSGIFRGNNQMDVLKIFMNPDISYTDYYTATPDCTISLPNRPGSYYGYFLGCGQDEYDFVCPLIEKTGFSRIIGSWNSSYIDVTSTTFLGANDGLLLQGGVSSTNSKIVTRLMYLPPEN